MITTVLAVVLAGVTGWTLSVPPSARVRLAALLTVPQGIRPPSPTAWVGECVDRLRQRRGAADRWRTAVIDLCEGLAAELVAGRAPDTALLHAAGLLDGPLTSGLAPALAATRTGGDVAAALERVAERPGAEGLRLLAACWRIGVERGGTLAVVVEGLATTLRAEQAHREEIAAQLAGPRATARLLAILPLLGLAMAAAVGARPLTFLFGTLPGAVCVLLGAGLDVLGLWWTRRLVVGAGEVR